MPVTAHDLINGKARPVTISPQASVLEAVSRMQKHDYSQLPIVDNSGKQQGLITSESILRSQKNLSAPLEKLTVIHAKIDAGIVSEDDNIFDVFELLSRKPAVLVIDNDDSLIGIITDADAANYLQQRAEDLMLIEDIETSIKDHIRASFRDPVTGLLTEDQLDAAIAQMVDLSESITKDITAGLNKYLALMGISHKLSRDAIQNAFEKMIQQNRHQKSFNDLTLNQYIDLLLHQDRWAKYSAIFNLEAPYLRKLLHEVRKIRNQLAHFRDEITEEQRGLLRYCRDLFDSHPAPEFSVIEIADTEQKNRSQESDLEPMEDEISPGESRYARLALYLQQIPMNQIKEEFTFEAIEKIIEAPLPPSAFEHRSWWANDTTSHIHSQQWLSAGWQIARVNLSEKRVTFTRSEKRHQMYIRFFSQVINDLKETNFVLRDINPVGVSWVNIATLPRGAKRRPVSLAYSFIRNNRFRVELYIDTGNAEENKAIFDTLLNQKEEIESVMGEPLEWEKLISKRASRIGLSTKGSIDANERDLETLRAWAVDRMIRFEEAIANKAEQIIRSVIF